jgi:hypothetical protein
MLNIQSGVESTLKMIKWIDYEKEKPPIDKDILILTKKGGVYRCRYLMLIPYNRSYTNFSVFREEIIYGEPSPYLVTHTKETDHDLKNLETEVTHWCLYEVELNEPRDV